MGVGGGGGRAKRVKKTSRMVTGAVKETLHSRATNLRPPISCSQQTLHSTFTVKGTIMNHTHIISVIETT